MKLSFEKEIELPTVPNYIILGEGKTIKREGGFIEKPKMEISEFTDEQLRVIGTAWTNELIAKAKRGRK